MLTRKELKQYLHRYGNLKAERAQIELMLHRLTEPKGLNPDGMPRSSGDMDVMASIVEQRTALYNRYLKKCEELDRALSEIENLFDQLDSRERVLMRHRYIEGMEWEKVCVVMNYSWRQTHRIHNQALDTIRQNKENRG